MSLSMPTFPAFSEYFNLQSYTYNPVTQNIFAQGSSVLQNSDILNL